MHSTLVLTLCFITGIRASPVPPSTSCSPPCVQTPPPLKGSTGSADNNSQNPNCSWSQWFNVYRPTSGPDGGDFETFENIRAEGHAVCSAPQAVSCRLVRFPDIPLDKLYYTQECGVSQGLVCENKNQGNDSCLDYEIKILCCTGQLANATESTKITTILPPNNNPEATPLFDEQGSSSGMEEDVSTTVMMTVFPNNNETTPIFDEQGSSSRMEEDVSTTVMMTVFPNNNETTPIFDEQGSSSGMEEDVSTTVTMIVFPKNNETTPIFDEQGSSSGMEEDASTTVTMTVFPNNNETTPIFDEQGSSSGMEEDASTTVKMTVFPNNNENTPLFEEQGSSSGMEESNSPEPSPTITKTVPPKK
ncbi:mucin-5B [Xenopus laevis]|uniref:Mucin-5B n=1 Tax=Xenopus laevis TaxID=8355 RepID=A0A8J0V5Z5_XENLA|nr:mucin-5B [Xenopus laevis]